MFDKHHLLKHGAQGQGVVTSHKEISSDQYGFENDYAIHVRFRFEDGTETELVHRWTSEHKFGNLRVGDKVPVRYNPADHGKIVLDTPALEAAHVKRLADAKATLKRFDEERIAKAQAEIAAQAQADQHKHHH